MEILADYHTHTVYSHGKGSIEDNVKVAISKGIKKIGISDHGYKNVAYGVKIDDFEKMREEIDILNEKYKNQIEILLGVECNGRISFWFNTYIFKGCGEYVSKLFLQK